MEPPAGWTAWSEAPERLVLAFRPDVFDGGAFPAPCLPTIYATKGRRSRRPGRPDPDPDDPWMVTLYLEPEVSRDPVEFPDREAAMAGARELAYEFAAGKVDYRGLYEVPREAYFRKLDELVGAP